MKKMLRRKYTKTFNNRNLLVENNGWFLFSNLSLYFQFSKVKPFFLITKIKMILKLAYTDDWEEEKISILFLKTFLSKMLEGRTYWLTSCANLPLPFNTC